MVPGGLDVHGDWHPDAHRSNSGTQYNRLVRSFLLDFLDRNNCLVKRCWPNGARKYHDRELSNDFRARVTNHLQDFPSDCPSCAQELIVMEKLSNLASDCGRGTR